MREKAMQERMAYLVRRRKPRTTESLTGYYLRLSEANGFDSPWQLFKRAGMEQHEWGPRGARTNKIAAIAKCRREDLEQIAYYVIGSPRAYRLLNHPVASTDIEPDRPKICIECVRDKEFIEAHWDLTYMVACPVHACWAVASCPTCKGRLSLFRRGLLICHCGSVLQRHDNAEVSPSARSLLGVVRARVLELLPLADFGAGLSIVDLHRLELRTLLRVIDVFGRCQITALGKDTENATARVIVCAAADVFSSWPSNFYWMLQTLAMRNGHRSDIREQFAPLYASVLKRRVTENPEALDFIREEFLKFMTHEWNGHRVDPRTLQRVRSKVGQPFVSGFELAQRLRIDPRTVKRHAEMHPLLIRRGPHSTFVVSAQFAPVKSQSAQKLLRLRQAAAEIGLPVNVLRALKESGDFEVTQQMPLQVGFRAADVVAFKSRLLALAPSNSGFSGNEQAVDLGTCMKKGSRYSISEKTALVRKLLHRSLPVLGQKSPGVKGLLVSSAALSEIIREERAVVDGEVISGSEAAAEMACGLEVLRELIRIGAIKGKKNGTQWKVTASSIGEFKGSYVALAAVASDLGTSSRRLIDLCRQDRIEMLFAGNERRGTHPFIRASDRVKLDRYASC